MTLQRQKIADYFRNVNWMLLLFLVIVLDVKMVVKIAGLIIFLFLNRKAILEKTVLRQKFLWFYMSMIVLGLLSFVINISSLSVNYVITAITGIGFWLMCIIAGIIIYWQVLETDIKKLHATITMFFILNIAISAIQLVLMIWDTGSVNPYRYQGMHQKYFIGAGDYITGITFDVSTTNALLSAMGALYFLGRNKMHMVLLCMVTLLLTGSNFSNLLLIASFLFLFLFQSNRNQKSIMIACLFALIVFLSQISPQNRSYLTRFFEIKNPGSLTVTNPAKERALFLEKPDSVLTENERKQKTAILYLDSIYRMRAFIDSIEKNKMVVTRLQEKPTIPKPNIHTEPYQKNRDTTQAQKKLLAFAESELPSFDTSASSLKRIKAPGKLVALEQTFIFLKLHPLKIITGAGLGNFSSKLAFRVSALGIGGGYPAKYAYINNDFKNNHLKLYLEYFTKEMEFHSLTNTPNSVYDQLVAEYGLLGIFSFAFFYLGYFLGRWRKLSYALPLLLLLIGAFGVEYWFEQLSIVIVFELLTLINLKEKVKNE